MGGLRGRRMTKGKRKKYHQQQERKTTIRVALWGVLGIAVVLGITIPQWRSESFVRFGPATVRAGDEVFVKIRLIEAHQWMRINRIVVASEGDAIGPFVVYQATQDTPGPPTELPDRNYGKQYQIKRSFVMPTDTAPGEYPMTASVEYTLISTLEGREERTLEYSMTVKVLQAEESAEAPQDEPLEEPAADNEERDEEGR